MTSKSKPVNQTKCRKFGLISGPLRATQSFGLKKLADPVRPPTSGFYGSDSIKLVACSHQSDAKVTRSSSPDSPCVLRRGRWCCRAHVECGVRKSREGYDSDFSFVGFAIFPIFNMAARIHHRTAPCYLAIVGLTNVSAADLDSRLAYPRPRLSSFKTKTETQDLQDQYWKSMTGMDCDKQKDWKSHGKHTVNNKTSYHV